MDTKFNLRINIRGDALARQLPTASKGTTITIILQHECVSMTENGITQVHLSAKVRNFQCTLFYKMAFYVVEIKCSILPTIENGHFIFSNESKNEYYDEEKIEWKCEKGFSHVDYSFGRRPYPFSPFPFDSIWYEMERMSHYYNIPPALHWGLSGPSLNDFLRRMASRVGNMTCEDHGWTGVPRCQRRPGLYTSKENFEYEFYCSRSMSTNQSEKRQCFD